MTNYNAVLARNTKNAPMGLGDFAQTVAFSHYNHLSAQLPIDPATNKIVDGGVREQACQCFKNIQAIVESIDHALSDVVRVTIMVKNIKDIEAIDVVYKQFFTTSLPTRTVVAVNDIPCGALIQVDAVLSNGVGTIPNAPQAGDLIKLENNTKKAPIDRLAMQIVSFSHYANISAQLPIVPESNRIISDCASCQAEQCLTNIKTILTSVDVPLDDIVKMTVFLTDMADFDAVKEVYTTFFPDSAMARTVGYFPALTVLQAAALPMGAKVQMEAVVSYGDGTPPQLIEDRHGLVLRAHNSATAPACAIATHSVIFSHYNNVGAQLPIDIATGAIAGDIKEQTLLSLTHIKSIVETSEHIIDDIVKLNIYLTDLADIDAVKEVLAGCFPNYMPACRIVGVKENLMGAKIQIDAVVANAEGTPPNA